MDCPDISNLLVEKGTHALLSLRSSVGYEDDDLKLCDVSILGDFKNSLDKAINGQLSDLRAPLKAIVSLSHTRMTAVHHSQVQSCWRRLYTDATIALVAVMILQHDHTNGSLELLWQEWIKRLDMVIIIAGAPGEGRLEMVHELLRSIQEAYAPRYPKRSITYCVPTGCSVSTPPPSTLSVTRLSKSPSLASFQRQGSAPFIISGWASDWPALTSHPWKSPAYLLEVAGPGRVVPVEVGVDYTREDWSQELMDWEEFLCRVGMLPGGDPCDSKVYLAQHNLLLQFPKLRDDIEVPDYIYADLGSSNADYNPPANDEQLVINAWLGPQGTLSPAHTDPYHNLYTQVVGRKTVWLTSPTFQREMYPFPHPDNSSGPSSKPASSTSLENTSSLDVFSASARDDYPLFRDHVLPQSMSCVLEPGDMLFIPAGWWHAMRSEDISFSVSMWF